MGKIVKMRIEGQNLQDLGKWMEYLCLQKHFGPRGLSAPAPGLIHVYDFNIQTSSSLKPLDQSKLNFMCLGKGNESLCKLSWSHDQDGSHGYR